MRRVLYFVGGAYLAGFIIPVLKMIASFCDEFGRCQSESEFLNFVAYGWSQIPTLEPERKNGKTDEGTLEIVKEKLQTSLQLFEMNMSSKYR